MISKLSPDFNTYFSCKSAFTSLLPWTVKQKVISPQKVIMVYLGVANKCVSVRACAHTHTHTHTQKSVRMLRRWSGCWTTEHMTSWNTPEREWTPARLGRNALHDTSFLSGVGTLWHTSVRDEENLVDLCGKWKCMGGTKTGSQEEAGPRSGQRTSTLCAVQHCRLHSACSSHFTFTWSWTGGEDGIYARIPPGAQSWEPPRGPPPYQPHVQCLLHSPQRVKSAWVRTGNYTLQTQIKGRNAGQKHESSVPWFPHS